MFPILTFCTTGWLLNQQAWKKWPSVAWLGMPTRLPVNSSCTTCWAENGERPNDAHVLQSCTWVPSSLFTIIHFRMLVCQRGPTEQYNVYTVPHNFIYLFIFNLKSILNQKLVIKLDTSVFSMLLQHRNPPPKNLNRGVPRLHSPDSRSWRTLSLRSLVESLLARVAPLRPVNEDPLASLWMCCCRCRRRSSGPAGRH